MKILMPTYVVKYAITSGTWNKIHYINVKEEQQYVTVRSGEWGREVISEAECPQRAATSDANPTTLIFRGISGRALVSSLFDQIQ